MKSEFYLHFGMKGKYKYRASVGFQQAGTSAKHTGIYRTQIPKTIANSRGRMLLEYVCVGPCGLTEAWGH